MNQTDISTDDDILNKDEPTPQELSGEFVRQCFSFKGQELRPYTAGTDLLFTQVLDRADAPMTLILAFIFIHLKERWTSDRGQRSEVRGQQEKSSIYASIPSSELLALCWNKEKFRMALFAWMESLGELTIADKDAATNLFAEMREGAKKSSVEVVPEGTEKKTKASRRRK
jgi:hypothetical protein